MATSGLEELQVMLVVTPPGLLEMDLSEEEEGEGSREGLCLALPRLLGQVQGAPGTHPMGCGCCDPWQPPAPRGLRDVLCGGDRGVGQEGQGGYTCTVSSPVPIPAASGLVAQAAGAARLAGRAAGGEQG